MRRAVFLDRDGTIIEDRGHLRVPSDVVFFPDTVPALRLLQRDFSLFIVTNQPGVAEGILSLHEVQDVNDYVVGHLARSGVRIEKVYCCPHRRSDGCDCIKPNPCSLLLASNEFDIDLRRSFVIGDHPHDVELARNAWATGIYLLTGHGARHRADLGEGTLIVSGIRDAASLLHSPGTPRE